ncbi:MAG: hypothetical protein R6U35_01665 [Candidatus Humimicrobiaceae bacterium]
MPKIFYQWIATVGFNGVVRLAYIIIFTPPSGISQILPACSLVADTGKLLPVYKNLYIVDQVAV